MKCTSNTMERTSQVGQATLSSAADVGGAQRCRADALKLLFVCFVESPLQFYVNHSNSPSVTAYGPGLSYGIANKRATFTVFTEDAYEGTDLIRAR